MLYKVLQICPEQSTGQEQFLEERSLSISIRPIEQLEPLRSEASDNPNRTCGRSTINAYIVVPVLNAMPDWPDFSKALLENLADLNLPPSRALIIDSESEDGTAEAARNAGFRVLPIFRKDFDHAATRQVAADLLADGEFLVYLTQDAVLAGPDSVRKLLTVFDDPKIGAAYGRQLPRSGASPVEAHARLFNYPAQSRIRSLETRRELGFKSIFFSNSFGAYRRLALQQVGGFSSSMILGEDTIVTARLHLEGWKTAYVGNATVYHSHSFPCRKEFQRYFDIGVLHARESWILEEFGDTGHEGLRFLISETRYLLPRWPHKLPSAWFRTVLKLTGYRMGRREATLSFQSKAWMSMNRSFWENEAREESK
jgi:rhamnosyltransferase